MKRCPSCQRTYEDDAQTFCINDGTPLVSATAPSSFTPGAQQGGWTEPAAPSGPAWSPPGVGTQPAKRSKWPWILAGVAVLLVGFVIIVGAVGFLIWRSSTLSTANRRAGINFNDNNNSNPLSNTNSGVPTDKEAVLKEMYAIEYSWCAAELKGDKAALDRILAPEFVATLTDGKTQNKQDYLATVKPDEYQRTCSYSDFSLGQSANYDVIIGYNKITGRDANGNPFTERYKFTDTFVWRDGRWQATASKSEKVK